MSLRVSFFFHFLLARKRRGNKKILDSNNNVHFTFFEMKNLDEAPPVIDNFMCVGQRFLFVGEVLFLNLSMCA